MNNVTIISSPNRIVANVSVHIGPIMAFAGWGPFSGGEVTVDTAASRLGENASYEDRLDEAIGAVALFMGFHC